MPSITTWTRLEGRSRRTDMRVGLGAPLHDPLWQVSVQLRLDAFRGEDAATPVAVLFDAQTAAITTYRPGAIGAPKAYDGSIPLEVLAEREPARRDVGTRLRLAAAAGIRFLELIRDVGGATDALASDYTKKFAMTKIAPVPDGDTARFLELMANRVPNGNALYAAFRPPGTPAGAVVVPADPDATAFPQIAIAAKQWADWYDALIGTAVPGDDAWVRDRLEYSFAVAAPMADGEAVLIASEYTGGRLDWDAFDSDPRASLGAAGGAPQTIRSAVLPTLVSFGGMPSPRFFEMEDGAVNLGKIDTGPSDLGRMLLIEFACLYGNDHFIIPFELPVGSICTIESLVVVDNFGGRTRIRSSEETATSDGAWQMYRVAAANGPSAPFLFLPPTLGHAIDGIPIEEVVFTRDEMANMAWAIERVVESPLGRPLDRHEAEQERLRRQPPTQTQPSTASPVVYRLMTSVPRHWLPVLPVSAGFRAIRLKLGEMIDPATAAPIPPEGMILSGTPALELFEEEVPRAGARVRRTYRYGRWVDGSTHLWVGRRKDPGRGESSSGLRFDVLEPVELPR